MSETRVASRYAKSLIEQASADGKLDRIVEDMRQITEVTDESSDLASALKNPIISSDKKLNILVAIFDGKLDELSMRFIRLVSKKNREDSLIAIAHEVLRLNGVRKGLIKGRVTTVMPLDDELRNQFRQMVKSRLGKDVELEEIIDETLLGGYILRVGDQQIDESIRTKLTRMERNFTDNSFKVKI